MTESSADSKADSKTESSAVAKEKQGHGSKAAAISSTVLWILGFVLPFMLPPKSKLIWLSDTLLLIGFWPLLWLWKPGWPWVVFGVLNVIVGGLLQIAFCLDAKYFPAEMLGVRQHLIDQHLPLSWMLIGVISIIVGAVRMSMSLARWFRSRSSSSSKSKSKS